MKKLTSALLTLAMMLSLICVVQVETVSVKAYVDYDLYPLACDAFQVARLNNSGGFDEVACTSNWGEAKNLMYAQGDAGVIRHRASKSATKIVDMSAGLVYSYPQRNGVNTATIKQYCENTRYEKTTYVTKHREMQYRGLYTYDASSGEGLLNVMLQGFDGYIHLTDVDLIPMKAVTDRIPIYIAGNNSEQYREDPVRVILRQSYYEVKQNGNYRDLVFHWYSDWPESNSLEPIAWSHTIGPAPDWMESGVKYYSYDCSTFYSDIYCKNQAGVYYPYYEFLPLRTQTKITAETLDRFMDSLNKSNSVMKGIGADFIAAGEKYGINALLMYAIGCLESGYGTSDYARYRNNLFGISAYDSDPNCATSFSSVQDCVEQEAGYFLRGFMQTNDYRFFGSHVGNKGSGVNVKYAGDPYWGMKIASIAYEIDKFANGYDGNLTDGNAVALGIVKDDERVNLLTSPNGKTSFNTAYGSTYQKNYTLAVLEEQDGWYKVQSTNYLKDGVVKELSNANGLETYDWNYTVYIPKDKVLLTNNTAVPQLGKTPTGSEVTTLQSAVLKDGILTVSGQAYTPGIYVTESNTAAGSITIYDLYYREIKRVDASLSKSGFDELTYTCALDLKDLKPGSYLLKYSGTYSQFEQYNSEFYLPVYTDSIQETYLNQTITLGGDNNVLSVQVMQRDCGIGASYDEKSGGCICLSGYENYEENKGCALKPAEEDSIVLRRGLDQAVMDEKNVVHLSGPVYFEGMNAQRGDDSIKAQIIAVNIETSVETAIDVQMKDLDVPYDIFDGYDYTRAYFEADLDLSTFAPGDYYLKIRLTNGEKTDESSFISADRSVTLDPVSINGYKVHFFANDESYGRVEITVEKNELNVDPINKPTKRASSYGENESIRLDNGTLTIDAFAYPQLTYVNEENHPVYTLILMNEEGEPAVKTVVNQKACTLDIAGMFNSKYKVLNSCFGASIDLKQLPLGTYRLFLDMKTDEVHDFIELFNMYSYDTEDVTVDGRKYSLQRVKNHYRYVLIISDVEQG